jgi:hypothetical protein
MICPGAYIITFMAATLPIKDVFSVKVSVPREELTPKGHPF